MKYFVETKQSVSLYDVATVGEMETFVRKVNKTWGAKPGYNDDRIMALTWSLIPLEKHIAEEYLEVLEYDEAGKPCAILDPNQNLSNLEFHNLKNRDKPIRDIGGGREFTPFFNVYTDRSPRILDKYQHMLEESSWEFV